MLATSLVFSFAASISHAKVIYENKDQHCRVELGKRIEVDSDFTAEDAAGSGENLNHDTCASLRKNGKIVKDSDLCASAGLLNSGGAVKNRFTGLYVSQGFEDSSDVIFASWAGGGLDFMPQDYYLLVRESDGYSFYKRVAFGSNIYYCGQMKRVK